MPEHAIVFWGMGNDARTVLAGVSSYALLIVVLRISGKRTLSKMNAFDFVVTVALGSTLATVLVSKDLSVATGFAALGTLVGMQYIVAWLSVRSGAVRRISRSEPTLLVRNGELLHGAMRSERVNADEVYSAIRGAGLADLTNVAAVVLETDGTFAVISSGPPGDSAVMQDVAGYPAPQHSGR
jgi:uncharacterized membrane protein YcaP (DUF421 family)